MVCQEMVKAHGGGGTPVIQIDGRGEFQLTASDRVLGHTKIIRILSRLIFQKYQTAEYLNYVRFIF